MTKQKLTKEQRLQKSLAAAAKILNKLLHTPQVRRTTGARALIAADNNDGVVAAVHIYQVFCTDENKVIGNPTTDWDDAVELRDNHNAAEGHISKIVQG